jgi:hypothetical protein
MRKTLYIPKDFLLISYKHEIFHLCKTIGDYEFREAFSKTKQDVLRLAEVIETYQKISESKDDIVEVSYEAKEGV